MNAISLTAYVIDTTWCFVHVPNERGRWLRTDHSVLRVDCELCGARVGEPCRSKRHYGTGTHFVRRQAFGALPRERRDFPPGCWVSLVDDRPAPAQEGVDIDFEVRRKPDPLVLIAQMGERIKKLEALTQPARPARKGKGA